MKKTIILVFASLMIMTYEIPQVSAGFLDWIHAISLRFEKTETLEASQTVRPSLRISEKHLNKSSKELKDSNRDSVPTVGINNTNLFQNNTQSNQSSFSTNNFSPSFGVHPSGANGYTYADDLGIDFNREGVYFVWEWLDSSRDGSTKFENATLPAHPDKANSGGTINYDSKQEALSNNENIEMMRNVCPFRRGGEFNNSSEKTFYQDFVERLAERYDGDSDLGCVLKYPDCYNAGDNEYPSELFIKTLQSNPVKYWQTCNQVQDTCSGEECIENDDYAIKYAEVQELTYSGVKAACPDCKVLIAGDSGKDEYPPVYESLNGKYIDIVDKHFFGQAKDYVKIQIEMDYLKNSLQASGFDLNELKFWITETGTYSGAPVDDRDVPENLKKELPYQSESQQAESLIKRYAVSFGEGIEKVLWAWGVSEGFGCDCCIFDYTGLIYDGNKEPQTCDANDPYDLGNGVKKLAYYSFKLMTDKIRDFDSVEKIQNSGNYIYKFTKNNKPIYVAWNDEIGDITLKNIDSKSVKITETVPKYETGQEVSNYDEAFNTEIKNVENGEITITVGSNPVFIEGTDLPVSTGVSPRKIQAMISSPESTDDRSIRPTVEPKNDRPSRPFMNKASANSKCGDGICGEVEKSKGLCPEDCVGNTNNNIPNLNGKCGDGVCGEVEKSKGFCPEDCVGNTNNNIPNAKGKCGDGVCDAFEKFKGVCPEDCSQAKAFPTQQGKCGDGICGRKEKANPNLCPEDC